MGGILLFSLYSIGLVEYGREIGQMIPANQLRGRGRRQLLNCGGHPKKIYGHVHIAKTGGSSINGIFANKFERVCGNKGYSFDAYHDNFFALLKEEKGETIHPSGPSSVDRHTMERIGYEDCDYLSKEADADWWIRKFGSRHFHNMEMELHVPCREPIDHLMSQCNAARHQKFLKCDAETDEDFFSSIQQCLLHIQNRYTDKLESHFDVKCYDFSKSFTGYIDYMKGFLEERRFETHHYVKRETNAPRHKETECIWDRADLIEKTRQYLLENVPYYAFCDKCIGSENEVTRGPAVSAA